MKEILEFTSDKLTLGGKPFYLASGDMHYFRFFKEGWERRLRLMKDFGLTTVQTYVPWNLHEPEEGQFCFDGNLNLKEFLALCDKIGLKVLFRPSGYMCSEWDFGGLPYWLLNKPNTAIRTSDPVFFETISRYYRRLAEEFVPYLSTNGGPIIAVSIENEYGSFSDDSDYLDMTAKLMREVGVDVPFLSVNGIEPYKIANGTRPGFWTGIDCHELTDEAISNIRNVQPDKPIYIAEFWAGRSQQWGGYFLRQKPEDVAALYEDMLQKGAMVNFYMFCGGTNFGFHNGALVGRYGADEANAENRYIPFATSYDVDAPITEYGEPTEKYFACKKVLKEYLESAGIEYTGNDKTRKDYDIKTQSIKGVKLTKSCDLLKNASNLAAAVEKSGFPLTMADMKRDYGFILYETDIKYTDDNKRGITVKGLQDRALIYGNGEYLGCYMRDRKSEMIEFYVPKDGMHLEILVENMGRVNYGLAMRHEKKGITDYMKIEIINEDGSLYPWDYTQKSGFVNISLPLNDLSKADFSIKAEKNRPTLFAGEFNAEKGVDTFINMQSWTKGVVYINGFNLGRYWNVGPQGTLYVPGELLESTNTIQIIELEKPNPENTVSFDDAPSLDTIDKTCDLVVSVVG